MEDEFEPKSGHVVFYDDPESVPAQPLRRLIMNNLMVLKHMMVTYEDGDLRVVGMDDGVCWMVTRPLPGCSEDSLATGRGDAHVIMNPGPFILRIRGKFGGEPIDPFTIEWYTEGLPAHFYLLRDAVL